MKTSYLICFILLILLQIDFAENGSTTAPKTQRKRMKNKGKRNNSTNRKSMRQPKKQLPPAPSASAHLPLIIADDTYVDIFGSLIGLGDQETSYNVLPEKKGHCSYNGMVMFDKAVWSPKPCITCLCSNGKTVCDEMTCPDLKCMKTKRRPGECCPICIHIEPNDPSEAELLPAPRTGEEMEEQLRREEEERQEEELAFRRKEEKDKKKKEKKRAKEEQERIEMEARRKEEEERERILEENRKANEEEEQRLEEEELKKREEEERRREEENKKRNEEKSQEKKKTRGA